MNRTGHRYRLDGEEWAQDPVSEWMSIEQVAISNAYSSNKITINGSKKVLWNKRSVLNHLVYFLFIRLETLEKR